MSKLGIKSKRKGKTYERRCAKILMEFTNTPFRSTPSSGGFNKFSTVQVKKELFCGDIICDDANFRYCVEAKNRANFSFTSILKSPSTSPFTKWWYQCVNDAKNINLDPMMLFKPNKYDDFVVFTVDDWYKHYADSKCPFIELHCYSEPFELLIDGDLIETKLPECIIADWKQFIKHINYKLMFKE